MKKGNFQRRNSNCDATKVVLEQVGFNSEAQLQ